MSSLLCDTTDGIQIDIPPKRISISFYL